jgi:hypothetical protein
MMSNIGDLGLIASCCCLAIIQIRRTKLRFYPLGDPTWKSKLDRKDYILLLIAGICFLLFVVLSVTNY